MKRPGSRQITTVSTFLFILMIAAIILSNHVIQICMKDGETAQENRMELHLLSQELADASDYLTEEVRDFAVTGDITHFYHYWHEVYQDKRRNTVIDTLSTYQLPRAERAFLAEAKAYSDLLIETESISMKLILLSHHITDQQFEDDRELMGYIRHVMSYTLPEEYAAMDETEMQKTAVMILYDTHYTETKTLIMTPIEQFQTVIHIRTDQEAEAALQGQHTAAVILMVCSTAVLLLIGLLIFGFDRLYIRPLNAYTKTLETIGSPEQDTLDRVLPQGAYELHRFGKIYNHLILMLEHELKKRTDAESRMRAALDEADRANQAKSDFLAQMSHELRTPIHAITGYTYLLGTTPMGETQKQYCDRIDFSTETLLGLINQILDFSKIEAGSLSLEITSFSLPELLYRTVDMMRSSAMQKKLCLTCRLSDDLPEFILSDPMKLRQVLVNLLGNAIKFTHEGTVTLTAESVQVQGKLHTVRISVQDSGIGIRQEDQKRIFEPFMQSDAGIARNYGGTGLGLPISQSIVRALSDGNYEIQVESEPGSGARFYFLLEFSEGTPTDAEQDVPGQKITTAEGITVLLVDDNNINLEMEKCILEQCGLEVTAAQSGEDALAIAMEQDFQMIFLDLHMPGLDGYETASRLRTMHRFRYTPIIALTADAVSGVREKIRQSDMNGYLSKPFQPEKLKQMIAEYLHIASEMPEQLLTMSNLLFDADACLQKLNGNEEMLRNLIDQFLVHHGSDVEFICSHLKNSYWQNAERLLHHLIGISGNLSCNRLYHCAGTLREQLPDYQDDTLTQLVQVWKETEETLRSYLSVQQMQAVKQEESSQPFSAIWCQFISLCNAYDIAAAECFSEYRTEFQRAFQRQEFQKLEEAVQKYDFPWIIEHMTDREDA